MQLSEKNVRWLETELVVVLAVVLLLGVLFGYSLAASRFETQATLELPGTEEPAPINFGVGSDDELLR